MLEIFSLLSSMRYMICFYKAFKINMILKYYIKYIGS